MASNNSPQIYLFLGGDSPCKHLQILNHPEITGAQVIYNWKRLEPQKDTYNFEGISKDLQCLDNIHKKLFIQLQDRSFSPENIPVPKYLQTDEYHNGIAKQTDNPGENKPQTTGWVTKQWNPKVQARFQKLIAELGKHFDGKIAGINLPETAIDTDHQTKAFCQAYFNSILSNMSALKKAFSNSYAVQYVNFIPCEWNNSEHYISRLFSYAIKHHIGLGNPDTVPYRKAQMKNSYPFFHRYHKALSVVSIAIQSPDYTYTNPKTGKKFTVAELYNFSKNYLGVNIIFWNIQEPEYSQKVLPFLQREIHSQRKQSS